MKPARIPIMPANSFQSKAVLSIKITVIDNIPAAKKHIPNNRTKTAKVLPGLASNKIPIMMTALPSIRTNHQGLEDCSDWVVTVSVVISLTYK
jgi:hypothetical protein